jgi:hypothetical protein
MANVYTGNPWILDTAAVIKAKGHLVTIVKMSFFAYAAGDDLSVVDAGGNPIWKTRAAAPGTNYEDYAEVKFEPPVPLTFHGFTVETLDNGANGSELWVWLS